MRRFDPERTPQELEPARVNVKAVLIAGTVGWLVALVVLLVLHLSGHNPDGRLFWMIGAGLGLGALGWLWAHLRHLDRPEPPLTPDPEEAP